MLFCDGSYSLHYELVWRIPSPQILLWGFDLDTLCVVFLRGSMRETYRVLIGLLFPSPGSSISSLLPWLSLPRSWQDCQAWSQTSGIYSNPKLLASLSQCAHVKNNPKEIWKPQSHCHKSRLSSCHFHLWEWPALCVMSCQHSQLLAICSQRGMWSTCSREPIQYRRYYMFIRTSWDNSSLPPHPWEGKTSLKLH